MKLERYLSVDPANDAGDVADVADPPPVAVKTRLLAFERQMTVREAITAIAEASLAHLQANEAAVRSGTDPEGVHQIRVAVRRLRSALGILRRCLPREMVERLNVDLQWFARQLSPARDWDVFRQDCLQPEMMRAPEDRGLRPMLEAVEQQRTKAYAAAIASIDAARYIGLKSELGAWRDRDMSRDVKRKQGLLLKMPIAELAGGMLRRRHKRLRKLGGKHRELSLAELHALRIKTKKMRYATEFFRLLYPSGPHGKYLAAIVGVQEALGRINDAAEARERLQELAAAVLPDIALAEAASATAARIARQLDEQIEQQRQAFTAAWRKYRRTEPFWSSRPKR